MGTLFDIPSIDLGALDSAAPTAVPAAAQTSCAPFTVQ
jgi:hypothetical protein